jgi:AcrR family transcriptional regulator
MRPQTTLPSISLRQLKKEQTREAIADTAMKLFVKRGFDHVTVAEVAAAAAVSEKTVFNYFPTKEDLFFDEVDEKEAALLAALRGRRPDESIIDALRRYQVADCRRMSSPGFAQFARLIEESPALRVKELDVMARFQRSLTQALREEIGLSDVEAQVAATLLIGVHWTVFVTARERALAGKHGPAACRRLRADLNRAYDLLERGLGDLATAPV